jgi:hypothetical protein
MGCRTSISIALGLAVLTICEVSKGCSTVLLMFLIAAAAVAFILWSRSNVPSQVPLSYRMSLCSRNCPWSELNAIRSVCEPRRDGTPALRSARLIAPSARVPGLAAH